MSTTLPPIFRLDCKAQSYDWGKVGTASKVAKFASSSPGFTIDENKPYAELWMGTHPNAPSTLYQSERSLESVLAAHPKLVTPFFHERHHGRLPFLFKVLSIGKALSIQAHPDKQLAEILFKNHPNIYKDSNHKPEMALALTEFEALCGFRPLDEIALALDQWPELWALVGDKEAQTFQEAVKHSKTLEGTKGIKEGRLALRALFTKFMKSEPGKVHLELDRLIKRLESTQATNGHPFEQHSQQEVILRIHSQYPGDIGVFCFFFLNYIILHSGQAIFLAANEPHAYLSGDCVECMAESDNVVRSGLTPKFKDVEVLTEMLTYHTLTSEDQILSGVLCTPTGHSLLYDPPIEEFSVMLTRLNHASERERLRGAEGPSIVLVTNGRGILKSERQHDSDPEVVEVALETGNVFFVGANTPFSVEATSEEVAGAAFNGVVGSIIYGPLLGNTWVQAMKKDKGNDAWMVKEKSTSVIITPVTTTTSTIRSDKNQQQQEEEEEEAAEEEEEEEEIKTPGKQKSRLYILVSLMKAWFTGLLLNLTQAHTVSQAAQLGAFLLLGVLVPAVINDALWEKRPKELQLIKILNGFITTVVLACLMHLIGTD
ncbi:Mannose-6-phosphate isomerase [Podila epigama]|nr:Mannose-6-phosphate isomerase [Podila epigama]